MLGTSAASGARLSGREHLAQSIRDILTTPVGSRVMRREYGSRLLDLVDRPAPELQVDLMAETADALARWEPRFRLVSAETSLGGGVVRLTITGAVVDDADPAPLAVEVPVGRALLAGDGAPLLAGDGAPILA